MPRPDAGQSSLVSAKQLPAQEAVASLGAGGVAGGLAAPALNLVPKDAFEAGPLANARFGMPTIAPQLPPQLMGPQMLPPQLMGPQMLPPQLMGPQMLPPQLMGPQMLPPELMGPQMMGPQMMDPQMLQPADIFQGAPEVSPEAAPEQPAEPVQEDNGLSAESKRPKGDTRSAAQIVDDTPALKNLGRQKDIKWDDLCKQTGVDSKLDIKDAKQNPDAVYRMAKVLEFIDSTKGADGSDRSGKVQNGQGDGNIEGLTKDGDARHGTEAGMLKDFAEQGYKFLGEHQLPTTNDTHVKADGSNKDNFQWAMGEAGKALWFVPGVSNVLTGIGNSEGGVGGVLKGAAGGVLNTWKGVAEGVLGAVTTGKVNPASLLVGAYTGALSETEAAPQIVKDIAGMF